MSAIVSRKLLNYQKLMFTCGRVCHTHPYQWNVGMNRAELLTSKWRMSIWYLSLKITVVYSIFLLIRALQIIFDENSTKTETVYIQFVVFYYAFPALFQTSLWVKKEELAPLSCLNATAIRLFQDLIANQDADEEIPWDVEQGNPNPPRPPRKKCLMPKIVDLFLDFVWYGFLGIIPFIGLLNCARPHSPEFISSFLAPSSGLFRWPIILLSATFQMYYAFTFMANSFVFIFQGFGCGIPAMIALKQIKGWLEFNRETDENKLPGARVARILAIYRGVQIISKAAEDCMFDLTVPASKLIMITLAVFCSYGAIRMEGYLAGFLGAVGILAVGVLVPMISMVALVHTYSTEILQQMKEPRFQHSCTLPQKKEVKSLQPIQLRMRRSYILDKECVKTVYQIIVDRTVELLLSGA